LVPSNILRISLRQQPPPGRRTKWRAPLGVPLPARWHREQDGTRLDRQRLAIARSHAAIRPAWPVTARIEPFATRARRSRPTADLLSSCYLSADRRPSRHPPTNGIPCSFRSP